MSNQIETPWGPVDADGFDFGITFDLEDDCPEGAECRHADWDAGDEQDELEQWEREYEAACLSGELD
jgi:hypothetical protein